jgi:hypothetical protein
MRGSSFAMLSIRVKQQVGIQLWWSFSLRCWCHYPALKITVRESHKGWRRQYHMIEGKPMPFESRPRAAWKICLQRSCTQLFKGHLWKCPALAYFATMERKLRLESIPAWQLFRDYKACPPAASDAEVCDFFATREIPHCGLCPERKIPFQHQDPTIKEHQP